MSSKTVYNREHLLRLRTDGTSDAAPASPEARIFDVWLPCVAKASYSFYNATSGDRPNFFARGDSAENNTTSESSSSMTPTVSSGSATAAVPSTTAATAAAAPAAAPAVALYTAPQHPITPTAPAATIVMLWKYRTVGGANVSNAMTFPEIAELVADDLIDASTTEVAPSVSDSAPLTFVAFTVAQADPERYYNKATGPEEDPALTLSTGAPGRYVPRKSATHNFPGPNVLHAASSAPPVPHTVTGRFGPTAELLSHRGATGSLLHAAHSATASRPRVVPKMEWSRDDAPQQVEAAAVYQAPERTTPPPPPLSRGHSQTGTPQHVSPALRPSVAPPLAEPPADLYAPPSTPPPAWRATLAGLATTSSSSLPRQHSEGRTLEELESGLLTRATTATNESVMDVAAVVQQQQRTATPPPSAPPTPPPAPVAEAVAAPSTDAAAVPPPKGKGAAAKEKANKQKVKQQPPAPKGKNKQQQEQQTVHADPAILEMSPPAVPPPTATVPAPKSKQQSRKKEQSPAATPPAGGDTSSAAGTSATPSRSVTPVTDGSPSTGAEPAAAVPSKAANRRQKQKQARENAKSNEATPPAAEPPVAVVQSPPAAPPKETGKSKKKPAKATTAVAPAPVPPPAAPSANTAAEAPANPPPAAPAAKKGRNNKQPKAAGWGSVAPTPVVDMQQVMHEAATSPPKHLYPKRPTGWRNAVGGGSAAVESTALPSLGDETRGKK